LRRKGTISALDALRDALYKSTTSYYYYYYYYYSYYYWMCGISREP